MENKGNEFFTGYVEHLVPLKEKSILFSKKIKIVFLAAGLLVALYGLSLSPLPESISALLLVGGIFLIGYLFRFTSVEYEYTILEGEMQFEVIYGKSKRKPYYTVPRGKFEKLSKVGEKDVSISDFHGVTKEVFCASTRGGENTWYGIVSEEGGAKTLVFFEMTPKAQKALSTYHRSAFTL
ncbi:MAG: hypothetical protein IKU24_00140 [Clostridia bacterium]|nr:hypothetical protein [Clostridia bacterium]